MQSTEFIGLQYINCEKVTSTKYMFYNCNTVQNLDVSGLNTSQVVYMCDMFKDVNQVESIDFISKTGGPNNFATNKVRYMEFMFHNCYQLQKLDMSSFNFDQPIISLREFMWNCYNLTEVNFENFWAAEYIEDADTSTNVSWFFENCSKLRKFTMGANFEKSLSEMALNHSGYES